MCNTHFFKTLNSYWKLTREKVFNQSTTNVVNEAASYLRLKTSGAPNQETGSRNSSFSLSQKSFGTTGCDKFATRYSRSYFVCVEFTNILHKFKHLFLFGDYGENSPLTPRNMAQYDSLLYVMSGIKYSIWFNDFVDEATWKTSRCQITYFRWPLKPRMQANHQRPCFS